MIQPGIVETGAAFLTGKAATKHPASAGDAVGDGFATVLKALFPPQDTVKPESETPSADPLLQNDDDEAIALEEQNDEMPQPPRLDDLGAKQGKLVPQFAENTEITTADLSDSAEAENFTSLRKNAAQNGPKPARHPMPEAATQIEIPTSGDQAVHGSNDAIQDAVKPSTTVPSAVAERSETILPGQAVHHLPAAEGPIFWGASNKAPIRQGVAAHGAGLAAIAPTDTTIVHRYEADAHFPQQGLGDNPAELSQHLPARPEHTLPQPVASQADPTAVPMDAIVKASQELHHPQDAETMTDLDILAVSHASVFQRSEGATQIAPPVRQILQQLTETPINVGDRVEITLSPEELGRVHLSARQTDHGVILLVQAERPETLDLMRRHLPDLMQDLQRMGFGDVSYSDKHPNQHTPQQPKTTQAHAETPAEISQNFAVSGLDLRL